jgi:hypothetical protein
MTEQQENSHRTIHFRGGWVMRALEYAGAGLAMLGTFLMATGVLRQGNAVAWLVWLIGSVLLGVWALRKRAWGVLALNVVYILFDIVGLVRAIGGY